MQRGVLIIDFGSQYTQLIARRVRELNVFCEIFPYNALPSTENYECVILSGSPYSVLNAEAPQINLNSIKGKKPLLAICYGSQYLVKEYGGSVEKSNTREFGRSFLKLRSQDVFLKDISNESQVWMSHSDTITSLPPDCELLASTEDICNAVYKFKGEKTYGIQFHPEVYHSKEGMKFLENFIINIAQTTANWTPHNFVEHTIDELKQKIGTDKIVLGLSGGVDSTVAAVLLNKAIGENLYCIFINNGLLRKEEFKNVLEQYKEDMHLNVKGVDASQIFLKGLKGVTDPEQKRKVIGKTFIDVFNDEATFIDGIKWLGQGTIYPDVIESVSVNGPSATIKSHHNVGGLPEDMKLKIVEPLRMLFKDEVRRIGAFMGIDPKLLGRHPFPGPGLAIRILGEITPQSVTILQEADDIFVKGLKEWNLYDKIWQAGAILLPVNSVGVMGDERTYEKCIVLRAVESNDGMTADWVNLPYEFLQQISNRIINKVIGINRVVYDISSKPPATIEWE